ncbi:MAG TPA: hypothetical protein PKV50_07220 [Prolixibacteraceae bacterium]|nr:hypothetical protein [Prolixibacteraceae bacterium]
MGTNYFTEDGHCWNSEEMTQFARFKVEELIDQNYSNDEIIGYDDSDLWKKVTQLLLIALKRYI